MPTFAKADPAPQGDFAAHRGDDRFDGRDRRPDYRDDDRRSDGWRGRDRDHDRGHDRDGVNLDIRIGGGYRPAYEERRVQVWVPAVYRTECEQVWVSEVCEDREVRYRDHGRWCTRVDHVVVTPGHFETRERQVLVSDGHYETHVERVRVAEREPGFGFHIGG